MVGSLINIGIIATLLHLTNNAYIYSLTFKDLYLNFSIKEIFLFAIIICTIDTISSLTFINVRNESQLYFILFGEGTLNNAVCVLLYKIVSRIDETSKNYH